MFSKFFLKKDMGWLFWKTRFFNNPDFKPRRSLAVVAWAPDLMYVFMIDPIIDI